MEIEKINDGYSITGMSVENMSFLECALVCYMGQIDGDKNHEVIKEWQGFLCREVGLKVK